VAYHVQCEVFEGPIDLLVSLAHRGQIDLSRVPLRRFAETYREQTRTNPDLDEATDVLVHLAILADLKARTLVPKAPPAEAPPAAEEAAGDLRDRLGAQMAEYLQFREAAQALRRLEQVQSHIFGHPAASADRGDEVLLDGVTLEDLFTAFNQVLHRAKDVEVGRHAAVAAGAADIAAGQRTELVAVGNVVLLRLGTGGKRREQRKKKVSSHNDPSGVAE